MRMANRRFARELVLKRAAFEKVPRATSVAAPPSAQSAPDTAQASRFELALASKELVGHRARFADTVESVRELLAHRRPSLPAFRERNCCWRRSIRGPS